MSRSCNHGFDLMMDYYQSNYNINTSFPTMIGLVMQSKYGMSFVTAAPF